MENTNSLHTNEEQKNVMEIPMNSYDLQNFAENSGDVKINSEVIAIIAGVAAVDIEGISGMSGGLTGEIAEMLGRKNLSKGVKVEVGEKEAAIDLYVIVEYGCRIPEVAWKCQEKVKAAVEEYCGLDVVEVNIHVQGININQDDLKPE